MAKNIAHELGKKTRTKDVIMAEHINFEGMMLSEHVLSGLRRCGFIKPSPVQLKSVPLGRCGFDLLIEGKSGTGKTLVFSIIALEMVDITQSLQVVIATPTREIAIQISDVISALGQQGLKVAVVTGGTSVKKDELLVFDATKPAHILVGSTGRLRHLITKNLSQVNSVRLFVLDEADKLVSSSLVDDINFIFNVLPTRKQIIATSATYTDNLRQFLSRYMNSPSHIRPDLSSVLLGMHQYIVLVKSHENTLKQITIKFEELKKIFASVPFNQCLVFCNYQSRAKMIHNLLKKDNWSVSYLSGCQTQEERVVGLRSLQKFTCRILVATDIAARGLDAANVDLVVNFDTPFELATYLHRIGRAGRFGSIGNCVSIISYGKEKDTFYHLLSGLNEDIHLENLWKGEAISLECEEIINHVQIDPNKMKSELSGKILNIVMSEDAVEDVIQDFSDLVTSIKDFESSQVSNEYKSFDCLLNEMSNFKDSEVEFILPLKSAIEDDECQITKVFDFIDSVLNPARRNPTGDDASNRLSKSMNELEIINSTIANNSEEDENIKINGSINGFLENGFKKYDGSETTSKYKRYNDINEELAFVNQSENYIENDVNCDSESDESHSDVSSDSESSVTDGYASDASDNDSLTDSEHREHSVVHPYNYSNFNLTSDYRAKRFNQSFHIEFIRQVSYINELCRWK